MKKRFGSFFTPGILRLLALWLAAYLILLGVFFNTITSNNRYLEIFPHELVFPVMMHALTALIVASAIYWLPWYRTFAGRFVSVTVLSVLMIGYDGDLQELAGFLKALTPNLTTGDSMVFVSIVYFLMLVTIAALVGLGLERLIARWKSFQQRDALRALAAMVAVFFLLPTWSLAGILPTVVKEAKVQAPELTPSKINPDASERPDIYYIVLDRYTNNLALKEQFDFDNGRFSDFLRQRDFVVNDQSYSNYPYTGMSIASTLNSTYLHDYVAPFKQSRIHSRVLFHNLTWQSSVVKALKKAGYEYHNIGSWYGSTYRAPLADYDYMGDHVLKIFGKERRLTGIEANEFLASPFYRLAVPSNSGWWPIQIANRNHVIDIKDQLSILNDLSTQKKPGGRFIFAHILSPHDPFVFNPDGSLATNPSADNKGKSVKQKYLDQVEFMNNQMSRLIDNILEQSNGRAVIVLNPDEGAYPSTLNRTEIKPPEEILALNHSASPDMRKWGDNALKLKFGIMQAVYMPKATDDDLNRLSSVNVFRILLNRYLGYDLEYLPQCHFGLTNGSQKHYNYVDISGKFTTSPDRQCQLFQSQ